MALIEMTIMSKSLMRNVPVDVVLPVDKMLQPGEGDRGDKPFKTLYLLHGIFGSSKSWLAESRIKSYAEEKNLAVVMPSGDNGFYVDNPASYNLYGQYVGEELVELTRKMFPLSRNREDTFIAGLSMGGFGALRNGLKYCETFGSIAALSSGLILDQAQTMSYDDPHIIRNRGYFESCFGDLKKALKSDNNPEELIRNLDHDKIPSLYLACGTEDFLIDNNRAFRDFLQNAGVDHTYEEGPGIHDWKFWDKYIARVLEWLPLEETSAGISDGNVN